MDVLGDALGRGGLPRQPEGCIGVMGHPVHRIFTEGPAVVPLAVVSIVGRGAVGRIDTVLSFSVILIDVATAVIKVTLCVWRVPSDIVAGRRLLVALGVDAIPQAVPLGKVRHAPRIGGGNVLFLGPPPAPGTGVQGMGAVTGACHRRHAVVLGAGLTGAGGPIVQDFGAAAPLGFADGEERPVAVRLEQQVRLGLQAAAPLAEVL